MSALIAIGWFIWFAASAVAVMVIGGEPEEAPYKGGWLLSFAGAVLMHPFGVTA